MRLREVLRGMDPNTVSYIGCGGSTRQKFKPNGSGFIFIGYVADALNDIYQYLWRRVFKIYPHETDYEGQTIIIEGDDHGRYWFWHEYDPEVPFRELPYGASDTAYEEILFAIARQCVQDYKKRIRDYMKQIKPESMIEVEDAICKAKREADLDYLKDTGSGQQLIQYLEDDIRIDFLHPKWKTLKDSGKINKLYRDAHDEMIKERVRKDEKKRYATIKGKSIRPVL